MVYGSLLMTHTKKIKKSSLQLVSLAFLFLQCLPKKKLIDLFHNSKYFQILFYSQLHVYILQF